MCHALEVGHVLHDAVHARRHAVDRLVLPGKANRQRRHDLAHGGQEALGVGIGTASATGLIWNDDTAGTGALAIARASAQRPEGNGGSTAFTFSVIPAARAACHSR